MITQLSTMKRVDAGSLPLGSILWFKGYGRDGEQWAVIDNPVDNEHTIARIEDGKPGTIYPGSPRPWNEAAGIGYYFPAEGNDTKLDNLQIQELIILSEQFQLVEQQRQTFENQIREEYTMKTKQWFAENVPSNVTGFIVAQLWEEDSDNIGEYTATKTILLAFSYNNRDIIRRMRLAAQTFEETMFLSEDDINLVQKSHDLHLGTDSITGWKIKLMILGSTPSYLDFSFVLEEGSVRLSELPSDKPTYEQNLTADTTKHKMFIENYSDKSIVVRGDTKPYKDHLGKTGLKGKFNKFLTDKKTGQKFAGWVFPMSRKAEIQSYLETL